MANKAHLARLKEGVEAWNQWREEDPDIRPNLTRAILTGATLSGADLSQVKLNGADLTRAILTGARLSGVDLSGATLTEVDLSGVNVRGAHLRRADLSRMDLSGIDFTGADLTEADLTTATLVETKLGGAILTGCRIYGIAAWKVDLFGAQQSDLVITPYGESEITVDNLEMAQFIYLLLHNEKIREVINTITSKAVLILGRFTPERKAVLEAIRKEIRRQHLLPIVFDFPPSARQTTLETVSTLAHMARFVIADLTDAKSVLLELQAIVPNNPSVPVQLILLASQEEPRMLDFIHASRSVLETYRYHSQDEVLASLAQIIAHADETRAHWDTGRT